MPGDRKDRAVRAGGHRREGDLLRRARAAESAGDLATAIEGRLAAADLRRRSGSGPELGEVLYDLAGTLLRDGRADDAVAALDEAEDAYGLVPSLRCADRVADVQVRRAVGYGLAGAGASAVVDAQSAVLHHRGGKQRDLARALAVNADVLAAYGDPDLAVASADLAVRLFLAARGPAGGRDREELRRALAVAVAVHAAHGRHDLAAQAGAVARRIGGLLGTATHAGPADPPDGRRTEAAHAGPARPPTGRRTEATHPWPAIGPPEATHAGPARPPTGRRTEATHPWPAIGPPEATHAGRSDRPTGRRRIRAPAAPAGVPTVLQGRAAGLGVTVAAALEAVRERLGREPPRVGGRPVVRPAVDLALVVPLDRIGAGPDATTWPRAAGRDATTRPRAPRAAGPDATTGPAGAGADAAARLGRGLAGLATALLPLDGPGGARLGMEAHALLTGASRLGSTLLSEQLPAFGPPWAAALLACSRRAEADGDLALALDLAGWGAGVVERLFPATLVDQETRAVATEMLGHRDGLTAALRSPPQ